MAKNVHKMMTKQFVKKIVPLDLIPDLSGIPPFHGAPKNAIDFWW